MISLGRAGLVALDEQDGTAVLAKVRPADGWELSYKHPDCIEMSLTSGQNEMVSVSLIAADSRAWIEISDQGRNETTRLPLDQLEALDEDVSDWPDVRAVGHLATPGDDPYVSDRSRPANDGPASGIPATGVAPGGGVPMTSLTVAPASTPATPDTSRTSQAPTTISAPSATTAPPPETTRSDDDDDEEPDDD